MHLLRSGLKNIQESTLAQWFGIRPLNHSKQRFSVITKNCKIITRLHCKKWLSRALSLTCKWWTSFWHACCLTLPCERTAVTVRHRRCLSRAWSISSIEDAQIRVASLVLKQEPVHLVMSAWAATVSTTCLSCAVVNLRTRKDSLKADQALFKPRMKHKKRYRRTLTRSSRRLQGLQHLFWSIGASRRWKSSLKTSKKLALLACQRIASVKSCSS